MLLCDSESSTLLDLVTCSDSLMTWKHDKDALHMYRFHKIDTSNATVSAQLYPHEEIVDTRDSVGLYDGKEKDLTHDNGTLYLTTHRLIYVDALRPHHCSCHLDLALIRQTEHWAGFLKSSPKITLTLGESTASASTASTSAASGSSSNGSGDASVPTAARAWVCRICGFSNSPSAKCTLCGVARDLGTASNQPSRPTTPAPRSITPAATSSPAERSVQSTEGIACPTCTFLNHPSMSRCEVCNSQLGTATTPAESVSITRNDTGFVRLSFRKGREKDFYAALKTAIVTKAWELSGGRMMAGQGESVTAKDTVTIGIDGILKTIDLNAQEQTTEMQDALQDLNALMLKAKDMVSLAQSFNARLSSNQNNETSTIVKSSLLKMGLETPALTQDMVRDEEEYHQGLARELAGILTSSASSATGQALMSDDKNGRGIVPIEEIWCIWNRARGISLVSPKDFRSACPHLPMYTWPSIELRTFPSGLTVLHSHTYAEPAFAARLSAHLKQSTKSWLNTIELAKLENLSVGLTVEMVEAAELATDEICRDEQAKDGLRWYSNALLHFSWSDPN